MRDESEYWGDDLKSTCTMGDEPEDSQKCRPGPYKQKCTRAEWLGTIQEQGK